MRIKTHCDSRPNDFMDLDTNGSEVFFQISDNDPMRLGDTYTELLLTDRIKVERLRDSLTEWLERNP